MEKLRKTPVRVVIVGAGAAGIAAASKLYQHGFEVVVLEAEDRIGGRIHSHRTENGTQLLSHSFLVFRVK